MKPPADFIMQGPTANDSTICLYPQNDAAKKEAAEKFLAVMAAPYMFVFTDEREGLKAVVELFKDGWRIG